MYKYLIIFLAVFGFHSCFASDAKQELENIVKSEFIHSQNFDQMACMLAMTQLEESGLDMPLDELINKFKTAMETEENLAKFYRIYQSILSNDEIHTMAEYQKTDASKKVTEKSNEILMNYINTSKEILSDVINQNGIKKQVEEVSATAVLSINEENYVNEIEKYQGKAVVVFSAPWCGACKLLKPVLEKISNKYAGTIKFAVINTDVSPTLKDKYKIRSLPTILFIQNGKLLEKKIGYQDEEKLESSINKAFKH